MSDPFLEALHISSGLGTYAPEGCGYVSEHPLTRVVDQLGDARDRMVAIQMTAFPDCWPEDERREMAEQILFGGNHNGEEL